MRRSAVSSVSFVCSSRFGFLRRSILQRCTGASPKLAQTGRNFFRAGSTHALANPQLREARLGWVSLNFLVAACVGRAACGPGGSGRLDQRVATEMRRTPSLLGVPELEQGPPSQISNSSPSPQPPGCDPPRLQERPHIPVPPLYDHGRRPSTGKTQNMGVRTTNDHNLLSCNRLPAGGEEAAANTRAAGVCELPKGRTDDP